MRLYLFGWLEGESLTRVIRYYAVPLAGGSLTVIVIFAPQNEERDSRNNHEFIQIVIV